MEKKPVKYPKPDLSHCALKNINSRKKTLKSLLFKDFRLRIVFEEIFKVLQISSLAVVQRARVFFFFFFNHKKKRKKKNHRLYCDYSPRGSLETLEFPRTRRVRCETRDKSFTRILLPTYSIPSILFSLFFYFASKIRLVSDPFPVGFYPSGFIPRIVK